MLFCAGSKSGLIVQVLVTVGSDDSAFRHIEDTGRDALVGPQRFDDRLDLGQVAYIDEFGVAGGEVRRAVLHDIAVIVDRECFG